MKQPPGQTSQQIRDRRWYAADKLGGYNYPSMRPMRSGRRALLGAALSGLLLLAATPGYAHAQSPSPLPPYVPDELLVKFVSPPTESQLEIFEITYRLQHVRPLLAPGWHLFHIEDGADAATKADWVSRDPLVCAVQLSFLGEWAATSGEMEEVECQQRRPQPSGRAPETSATSSADPREPLSPTPASAVTDTPGTGNTTNALLAGAAAATVLLVLASAQATRVVRSIRRRLAHR